MSLQVGIMTLIKDLSRRLAPLISEPTIAEQEAWWMLEKLTQKNKARLLLEGEVNLSVQESQMLDSWIIQRVDHKKPLQYILGSVPFAGLDIIVQTPILIPRIETEEWITWLIKKLQPVKDESLDILDLCSGSGCIALALAAAFPKWTITGIDINQKALELANKNKLCSKLENVDFILSNLYQRLNQNKKFDVIVSNPPYLSAEEYRKLTDDVKLWEDPIALQAEQEGLAIYERIIEGAKHYLKEESCLSSVQLPRIIVELGQNPQGVQSLFEQHGFQAIQIHQDMQQKERWATVCV